MVKARYYRGDRPLRVSLYNILKVTELLRQEDKLEDLMNTLQEQHLDLSIVKDLMEPAAVAAHATDIARLSLHRSADLLMRFSEAVGGADAIEASNAGTLEIPPDLINGVKRFMVQSRLIHTNATARDVAESRKSFECELPG